MFGVIADETTDISNKEQFSICLRYVLHGEVFESFVGFCETSSTTGDVLYQLLKSKLLELGLDIEHLVGQCCDGASNMSGSGKGVAARVQEVIPNALYVHCHAHLLNLALQDTLENNEILQNGLGVIQSIYNFFNSPKRQSILQNMKGDNLEQFLKLKSLSKTLCACHWEAVKAIERQILRTATALVKVSESKEAKLSVDSKSLLTAFCNFRFILGLLILKVIFSNTNALAVYLQNKQIYIITAKTTAETTVTTLQQYRNSQDFLLIWKKAKDVIAKLYQNYAISRSTKSETFSRRLCFPSRRLQALVGESTASTDTNELEVKTSEEDLARV